MVGEGKILRKCNYFKFFLVLSLIPIILEIVQLFKNNDKFIFVCLIPISILFLFKCADNYILKKLNRHFYFSKKHCTDIESKDATWLEFFIQMFIAFGPLFFWIFISEILL
ncbi:hypothetical protein EM308_17575 [Flavobacterium gilvum]|uniref:Uncharacterized protein n=1 Tax=Flavobacterium gilvum TaxID=1492737 RepID=A0AAC9I7C2_9FLAO|nr:hypothetical protein EM308_17575 [Flavobacterium gilvum]